MHRYFGVLAAGLVLTGAATAQAGIIMNQVEFSGDSTIVCDDPAEPYSNTYHTFTWTSTDGTMVDDARDLLDIHTYTYTTDQDPVFHLISTVTNNTTMPWTSFIVDLGGTGLSLSNPTASPYLSDALLTNSNMRIVYTGTPVPVGATNTFEYDITLPDTGGFPWAFSLVMTAVPEPTSLGLLGLGAASMLLRRRKCA